MADEDYDKVIGKLHRIKVWLKPVYHEQVNDLINALIDEAEKL